MSQQYSETPQVPGWATLGTLAVLSEEFAASESPPFSLNMVPSMRTVRGWREHGGAEVDLTFEAYRDTVASNDVYSLLDEDMPGVQYCLSAMYQHSVPEYPPELVEQADCIDRKLPVRKVGARVLYVYNMAFVYDTEELHWRESRDYMLGNKGALKISVDLEAGSVGNWIDDDNDDSDEHERTIAAEMGVPYVVNPAKLRIIDALTLFKAFERRSELIPLEQAIPRLD